MLAYEYVARTQKGALARNMDPLNKRAVATLRFTPPEVQHKVPSAAPADTTATTNLRGRLQDATTTRESAHGLGTQR